MFVVTEEDEAAIRAALEQRGEFAAAIELRRRLPGISVSFGLLPRGPSEIALLTRSMAYSRPRVSDDNAFAEALFRTAKYRPEFPIKGFCPLQRCGLRERASWWTTWRAATHGPSLSGMTLRRR